jgi:glycosyltransferase involved in cell wall biosynthesis
LCYNHQAHVRQAIDSVIQQSYENVELIVVDDASTDKSRELIRKASAKHGFRTIFNEKNLGNCRSFNTGFKHSTGKYVIDLAADDLLMPDRVAIGVELLEQKGPTYGVHFSDATLIDSKGKTIGTHYRRDKSGNLLEIVPEGDIYADLVEKYLICTPSMMISRKVLEDLNGYDESLTYEDFDFWVRSSRNYYYGFSNALLVSKTIMTNSLSKAQMQKKNIHALSTASVCEKILKMNRSQEEHEALLKRVNYELKWALITENWEASKKLIDIKERLPANSTRTFVEKLILGIRPPWFSFWKLIMKLRY